MCAQQVNLVEVDNEGEEILEPINDQCVEDETDLLLVQCESLGGETCYENSQG